MNFQRIIAYSCQPTVIISILIAGLLVINDFTERFTFSNNAADFSRELLEDVNFTSRQLSEAEVKKLVELYSKYILSEEVEQAAQEENKGLSLKQQLAQTGELSEVYVGEYKIELKAVIDASNSNKKALLLFTNVKTAESKIEEYQDNTLVHDFNLKVMNNTQVYLSRTHAQGKQEITLNMYQVEDTK